MYVVNIIALILLLVGGLNWGLIGFFRFNLVSGICGSDRNIGTTIIYLLVFFATIWLIISLLLNGGVLTFMPQ